MTRFDRKSRSQTKKESEMVRTSKDSQRGRQGIQPARRRLHSMQTRHSFERRGLQSLLQTRLTLLPPQQASHRWRIGRRLTLSFFDTLMTMYVATSSQRQQRTLVSFDELDFGVTRNESFEGVDDDGPRFVEKVFGTAHAEDVEYIERGKEKNPRETPRRDETWRGETQASGVGEGEEGKRGTGPRPKRSETPSFAVCRSLPRQAAWGDQRQSSRYDDQSKHCLFIKHDKWCKGQRSRRREKKKKNETGKGERKRESFEKQKDERTKRRWTRDKQLTE